MSWGTSSIYLCYSYHNGFGYDFYDDTFIKFSRMGLCSKRTKTVLQRKLLLFFGRPETGGKLLSVYKLLFGKQLSYHQVIAAHYTTGTDVNPTSVEQFLKKVLFLLINRQST